MNDTNKLYIPQDGRSINERSTIMRYFPQTDGSFMPSRSIDDKGIISLLITAQDGGNVLRPDLRDTIKTLNQLVTDGLSINVDGIEYHYR